MAERISIQNGRSLRPPDRPYKSHARVAMERGVIVNEPLAPEAVFARFEAESVLKASKGFLANSPENDTGTVSKEEFTNTATSFLPSGETKAEEHTFERSSAPDISTRL